VDAQHFKATGGAGGVGVVGARVGGGARMSGWSGSGSKNGRVEWEREGVRAGKEEVSYDRCQTTDDFVFF